MRQAAAEVPADFYVGPRPAQIGWKVIEFEGRRHPVAVFETMQDTAARLERGEAAPKCPPKPKLKERQMDKLCWCGRPARHRGKHVGKKGQEKEPANTAPSLMAPLTPISVDELRDRTFIFGLVPWNEKLPTIEESDRFIAVDPPELHELAEVSIAFYLNPNGNTEGDRLDDFMKRSEEMAERIRRHREIKKLVDEQLGAWLQQASASTEPGAWAALWQTVHGIVTKALDSVERSLT